MTKAVVYDYETLGTNGNTNAVLSLAALEFDITPDMNYKYEDLVAKARAIKFDVTDQVKKHGRTIDKNTLKWWSEQGGEAQAILKPSEHDQPISSLVDFLDQFDFNKTRYIFTRGDMDPLFTKSFYEGFNLPLPYAYYKWRDTRSLIDGLSLWEIKDNFDPVLPKGTKVVKHDARYDVALDVMRIQQCINADSIS